MTTRAPSIDTGSLALRMAEDPAPNGWAALVVLAGQEIAVANELAEAIRDISGAEATRVEASCSDHLVQSVSENGVRVIIALPTMDDAEWVKLDRARSRLLNQGTTILVLGEETMNRLGRSAPNLQSWIGPSLWSAELTWPALSPEEKEDRLAALREWSGLSDHAVVSLAEQGTLPTDPEYAEWLVLLDRGDLIP